MIAQVLILHHKLEVLLHSVLMLLRNVEQVFSQLVIADEYFLDDGYRCDKAILVVTWAHADSSMMTQTWHRQAQFTSHLILHGIKLLLRNTKVESALTFDVTRPVN